MQQSRDMNFRYWSKSIDWVTSLSALETGEAGGNTPYDARDVGTGLKDKQGAEIFENDIVEVFYECPVEYHKLRGVVVWNRSSGAWYVMLGSFDVALCELVDMGEVKVIGNEHANPGLCAYGEVEDGTE